MTLVFGQRMVRLDDGMQGSVAQDGPDLRIVYIDRGEERLAAKSERWLVDELKPGPLLRDEKFIIARCADRALRAFEKNEPHKTWEPIRVTDAPYDPGLIQTILDYLSQRETLPAG
jgi:hypothetical protein